jgi:hypothetical protein
VIEYHGDLVQRGRRDNTPALMARWGRTTDIEWIYRVTLGADGRPVSEVYQAPNHAMLPFTGVKIATTRSCAPRLVREGKVDATPSPATSEMSDQRDASRSPRRTAGSCSARAICRASRSSPGRGSAVLTPAQPAAVIWSAAGE